jgi:hypothetical protein
MSRATSAIALVLGGVLVASLSGLAQTRTPTPRGRPRLSGGFGRPRVTPTPGATGEAASATPSDTAPTSAPGKPARPGEKSTVSITNETLVTDPSKGKLSTSQGTPAVARPAARTVSSEVPFSAGPTPEAASAEETKWRTAARTARERVETLKARVTQYEGEAAKLESDFYAWDDGQYRDGVIKPAWDRKKEELEQARKDLAEAEKELADLPEEARKAGALPGWLRE